MKVAYIQMFLITVILDIKFPPRMNTYEFLCILDLKANTNYRTYMI